jgi:steroid delta-isomerase-like uncharacterized protein
VHDSKAFLASVYETVRSRDIDELVDHFSEDCVFVDVPLAETAQGRDAFRAYMEETFRGLPDFQPESWAFVAEGQNVAAELVLRGTHEGPFMGHGPTHREIRWRASAFYSLSPSLDQVMREVYYYDLASLEAQLGSDRA